MDIDVNVVALLCASVAALVIGGVWYSKLAFGESWMRLVGLTEERAKAKMGPATAGMFVLSLLMGYMLSHVTVMSVQTFGYSAQIAGITSGLMMWLGFVVPTMLGVGLFEQRSIKLIAITLGNWLVTLLAMGAIIGFFGF